MLSRLFQVDLLLSVTLSADTIPADAGPGYLLKLHEQGARFNIYHFYTSPPPYCIQWVTRNKIPLENAILQDAYLKVRLSVDQPFRKISLPDLAGHKHLRISIDAVYHFAPDTMAQIAADMALPIYPLTTLLAYAPRVDQAGVPPALAELEAKPSRLVTIQTYLPRPVRDYFLQLGDGNLSAGVRRAAEILMARDAALDQPD